MRMPFNTVNTSRFHVPVFFPRGRIPDRISIREHSLKIGAMMESGIDTITGATGFNGCRSLLYLTTMGQPAGVQALIVELGYERKDKNLNCHIDEMDWVHLREIKKSHRAELVELINNWLPSKNRAIDCRPADVDLILLQFPWIVGRLFKELPRLLCLAHYPAELDFNFNPISVLRVGTVRVEQDRFNGLSVLHMPGLKVAV